MIEWLNGNGKHWMGLVAAVIGSGLGFFILLRSPRNVFSTILFLFMVCVAEWNAFEFVALFTGADEWPTNLCFIGISFLIALVFHFAVSFIGRRRLRLALLVPVYVVAAGFAAFPIAGLFVSDWNWHFVHGFYNVRLLEVLGPVMVVSLALMLYWAVTGPPALRGVHACFLWAGLAGVPLGILDLMKGAGHFGARLGNLGAVVACCVLFYGALRHRQVFDIVARSRAEARSLFARTQHGLLTIDPAGRVIDSNDAVEELLGCTPESLTDIDADLEDLAERGGQRMVVRDGRVLKATLVASWSPAGGKSRSHLVLEDATHEYELLHELAQRESLASLGEAAATLAHEIKNPLTAIGMTVEGLAAGTEGDVDRLDRIRSEVRRLDDLLGRSLSLARPLDLDRQSTDLDRLIRRTLELAGREERVAYRPPAETPRLNLDPEQIRQVLLNLVKNAEETGAEAIEVSTAREADRVVVRVRNDGPSIPPEVMGRLFQPFVTTKARGTGLGLALCRKIMHAHGGEIVARNVDGGVEFEMSVPWTS